MNEGDSFAEVLLQPGEFYFGDRSTRIRTLLGSCVAITMWHPRALIGGMCHYMMPSRRALRSRGELDGRYADEAVMMFMHEMNLNLTRPHEYEVKMFGGGNQFAGGPRMTTFDVAGRNVQTGLELLQRNGLSLTAMHLGGNGHRQVILDVWNGNVWMRHVDHAVEGDGG